jgi:hypothetical protein
VKRALLLLVLCGCPEPRAVVCDDGLFCPPDTTCGGFGLCLVSEEQCMEFPETTPCQVEVDRGFCRAGSCVEGVELIGATETFPIRTFPEGVTVFARDHPEIVPSDTNVNGYFGLFAPHQTELVLEVSYPDAHPIVTRRISVGEDAVAVDVIYGGIPIVLDVIVDQIADSIGVTLDPARGVVIGSTFDPDRSTPLDGVVASVADGDCGQAHYFDAQGPVVGATSTFAETGVFVLFNCLPGAVDLVADRAGVDCRTIDKPAPIALDVVAGKFLFVGRVTCVP